MKPAAFHYVAARSVEQALDALVRSDGDAKLLAGGQSLIPLLNMRLASPARLVDLNRVPELAYVQERDGGIAIGAMTRDRAVERNQTVATHVPLLAEAIARIGHPQIRNRGTLGGSIAHADPAAELPAVAVCLDARLTVHGPGGTRTIGADQLYAGYLTTTIQPDEVLTEAWFPTVPPCTGQAWLEFARRHGDYAIAGVGACVTLREDGAICHARLALSGVAGAPVRAGEAEAILAGGPMDGERVAAAVDAVRRAIDPHGDVHATPGYRRHLAGVLVERALETAYARAVSRGGPTACLS